MVGRFGGAGKPAPGSWLDRWLRRRQRHPLAFPCGVRTIEGRLPGAGPRWRFRDSALDPHPDPGEVALHHGAAVTLRLVDLAVAQGAPTRTGHLLLRGRDLTSGATVELSVPLGEAEGFGVPLDLVR